jgi:hypothetical protein
VIAGRQESKQFWRLADAQREEARLKRLGRQGVRLLGME